MLRDTIHGLPRYLTGRLLTYCKPLHVLTSRLISLHGDFSSTPLYLASHRGISGPTQAAGRAASSQQLCQRTNYSLQSVSYLCLGSTSQDHLANIARKPTYPGSVNPIPGDGSRPMLDHARSDSGMARCVVSTRDFGSAVMRKYGVSCIFLRSSSSSHK